MLRAELLAGHRPGTASFPTTFDSARDLNHHILALEIHMYISVSMNTCIVISYAAFVCVYIHIVRYVLVSHTYDEMTASAVPN